MNIEKLKKELDKRNLSQRQFGIICNLDSAYVSRLLNGAYETIKVDTCKRIVDALDLDAQTAYSIFLK